MVIDAHAHIFDRVAGIAGGQPLTGDRYGRLRQGNRVFPFMPPSFTDSASSYELLLQYMDVSGVDKAVLMPNTMYGYFNHYALEAMRAYPGRFLGVALVDVAKGREAADELDALLAGGDFTGLKIEMATAFQCKPGSTLDDPCLLPVWECLSARRQPLFTHLVTARDWAALKARMADFPKVPVVLCHLGASAILGAYRESREAWDELLTLMERRENLLVDTSCAFLQLGEEYPYPETNARIEEICARAGAERVLWGTDYPGVLPYATMTQLLNQVRRHLRVSEADKDKILGMNAQRLFEEGYR